MTAARTIMIGAGAIGALVVFEQLGKKPGPANTAALAELASRQIAGVSIGVSSGSAAAAHRAMRNALEGKRLTADDLEAIGELWLDAFRAGCEATAGGAVTGGLYNETAYNYALVRDPAGVLPGNCSFNACGEKWAPWRTPIGKAVCAVKAELDQLEQASAWGSTEDLPAGAKDRMYARTLELARAMDAADYRRDGDRAHDALPGPGDLPGLILDSVVGDIITSPVFAVAVLGLVAWKVWG